ncbi:zinc-finger homeodomain protein 11-like [Cynara cardunculus var. scolymus]|uniref:Homeodomain-like protein n=1 Tax=Cynara cardunculus var. scolymus TaxID=59895 RepID=A0A118K5H7_CYNCS|nr:zinc-finger homeodomain protein 11-like [Cynara cardunculus var. scolymus]KVI09120.1 Homeodomain-like protein [Cynara cardunculus var. scolymus]
METPTPGQPNRMGQQLPPSHNPPQVTLALGRCLKNHAAGAGGYALDGCGEFMLAPTSTPTDLTTLKCDVCGCHRNFHYREVDQLQSPAERVDVIENPNQPQQHHHLPTTPTPTRLVAMANSSSIPNSPTPSPISSSYNYYPAPPHMFFAFNPAGFPAPEPADRNGQSILTTGSNGTRKKRFRSKFSQDQKAKMQEFAERIGWKMPKKEDETIAGFCNEIGVDKGVFKVWMHNHKNISIRENNHQKHRDDGGNANGANGSSSSS